MNLTVAGDDFPVLTPPPNPSKPQKPTPDDMGTALIFLAGGDTAATQAANAKQHAAAARYADYPTVESLRYANLAVADSAARASAAAVLAASGWTAASARLALRATGGNAAAALRNGPALTSTGS